MTNIFIGGCSRIPRLSSCIKIFRVFLVAVACAHPTPAFCSCGDPVALVKPSTMKFDPSVTVGNALDKYSFFNNATWKSTQDPQGRSKAIFEGTMNFGAFVGQSYNDIPITAEMAASAKRIIGTNKHIVEFSISANCDSFQITNSYHRIEVTDAEGKQISQDIPDENLEAFQRMYKNEPDLPTIALIIAVGIQPANQPPPAPEQASGAESLCSPEEKSMFTCRLEKSSKSVSLCQSKIDPKKISYKFGTPQKIENTLPTEKSGKPYLVYEQFGPSAFQFTESINYPLGKTIYILATPQGISAGLHVEGIQKPISMMCESGDSGSELSSVYDEMETLGFEVRKP